MHQSYTAIRCDTNLYYSDTPPFDPDIIYPEFKSIAQYKYTREKNGVYENIRQCLIDAKLDYENCNTDIWSPFKHLINEGDTVVIKPNLVLNTPDPTLQNTVTTHGSVIRPIIDYTWKALNGKGKIIVGDAPQAETDFDEVVTRNGLKECIQILQQRGYNIELLDFRGLRVIIENGIWVSEQKIENQSLQESVIVNLGRSSCFYEENGIDPHYHGGGYDSSITVSHHHGETHEYKIAKEILTADVVISVPKLKTHKKAGFTCCMKNLVGINTDKNFLPHFCIGAPNKGGDEFPNLKFTHNMLTYMFRRVRDSLLDKHWRFFGKYIALFLRYINKTNNKEINLAHSTHNKVSGSKVFQGAWQGNLTICKMIIDLNKIFLYASKEGHISNEIYRKHLYIVDGIIIGDRNGPMDPNTVSLGIVGVGDNAYYTDITLLKMLNVNPENIPLYRMAQELYLQWLASDVEKHEVFFNGEKYTTVPKIAYKLQSPDNWQY